MTTSNNMGDRQWNSRVLPGSPYCKLFYDGVHELRAHQDFFLTTNNLNTIARNYVEEDKAWLVHRRSSMKITCHVHGPLVQQLLASPSLVARVGNNSEFYLVSSLYLVVHMTRDPPSSQLQQLPATASHISPTTIPQNSCLMQKVTAPPKNVDFLLPQSVQIYPTTNPASSLAYAEWAKLQFTSATVGNGKSLEFREHFRLVVSLVATLVPLVADPSNSHPPQDYFVASVVSSPLTVIGQNPGRYKNTASKSKKRVRESPPSPTPASLPLIPFMFQQQMDIPMPAASIPVGHHSSFSFSSDYFDLNPPSHTSTPSPTSSPDPQDTSPLSPTLTSSNTALSPISGYPTPPLAYSLPSQFPLPTQPSSPWSISPTGSIYHFGAVGINMQDPLEALSVGGNILVGGNIMKPSDRRIKRNFVPLGSAAALDNIRKLKLYDYERVDISRRPGDVVYVPERGVIAQEVQSTMPSAVKVVGNVQLPDGTLVNDMLVVDDRVLLLENIGATQELGRALEEVTETTNANAKLAEKIHKLVSTIANSEKGIEENSRYCNWFMRLHLFGLGPCWSLTILGFFFPVFWIIGTGFLFSVRSLRQVGALASFIMFTNFAILLAILTYVDQLYGWKQPVALWVLTVFWCLGICVCTLVLLGLFFHRGRPNMTTQQRVKLLFAYVKPQTSTKEQHNTQEETRCD